MYPYRVFLSYASAERDLATHVADVLSEVGLHVLWDHVLTPGQPFTEELKAQIARSHLFIPLLTRKSMLRPWVHQETGYAMGVGIPILPIVVGKLVPVALIQQLQALRIDIDEDVSQLKDALKENLIRSRVEDGARMSHPTFESVDHPERRTQAIVRHAHDAQRCGGGRVRQSGAMTSFALPNIPPPAAVWEARDAPIKRSRFLHEQLYQERVILEELAAQYGCDLVIDPTVRLEPYSLLARKTRLKTLRAFLVNETRYPNVRAVARTRAEPGNILIVGDWFYAESITPEPGAGYRQTLLTWHAPTVLIRMQEFDLQFEQSLAEAELRDDRLRFAAAVAVEKEIRAIHGDTV